MRVAIGATFVPAQRSETFVRSVVAPAKSLATILLSARARSAFASRRCAARYAVLMPSAAISTAAAIAPQITVCWCF
jgi:hypothetical protein